VTKERRGNYTVSFRGQRWNVWRGIKGRWLGESPEVPGKMVDAPTLQMAVNDVRNGYLVDFASGKCPASERVAQGAGMNIRPEGEMAKQSVETMRAFRIDRRCPRCRAYRCHWYSPLTKKACCAECSHTWCPRITRND
jgi:hypothetical protein